VEVIKFPRYDGSDQELPIATKCDWVIPEKTHPPPPDGWQEFLTPPCSRISCTSNPLPLPGFPRPETPPPTRIP